MSNSDKIKVLLVAEAVTLAHISRIAAMAASLPLNAFDLHLACRNNFPIALSNFRGTIWPIISRTREEFAKILSKGAILFDADVLERYIKAEVAIIEGVRPDVIVGDLRPSLAVSAEITGVPYINLTNAYWSQFSAIQSFPLPVIETLSRILPKGKAGNACIKILQKMSAKKSQKIQFEQGQGLNQVRQRYGLPPFENYLEGFTYGNFTAFADLPEVVQTSSLPSNHRYIGPLPWSPSCEPALSIKRFSAFESYAYVCLGSSGPRHALPLVVETLRNRKIPAIVATGGAQCPQDPLIYSADLLPGAEICKTASLVICNGGSPGVYQALLEGRPVIGIASNMDQFLFMQHVEDKGLGLCLRSDTLTPGLMRAAIDRILNSNEFVQRCRAVQFAAAKFMSTNHALNLILEASELYADRRVHNL